MQAATEVSDTEEYVDKKKSRVIIMALATHRLLLDGAGSQRQILASLPSG